jgi:peptide-methionine (S)-S-oxide reductase
MESTATQKVERAIFAGGCFWCMEPVFDKVDGVLSVMPGYTGGEVPDPSYPEVCEGDTGHAEAVLIRFDPDRVSFRELINVFWRNIDPTTRNRQFCDFGSQYRTAVFYTSDEQRSVAEETRRALEKKVQNGIVTEIVPAVAFYPAEEYHQQYYKKNPERYKMYHDGCGRNWRLKELWGNKE